MPELPEVEVLCRHLAPLIEGRNLRSIHVHRLKLIAPQRAAEFTRRLTGARVLRLQRRAKYLVFTLRRPGGAEFPLLGHLGMTGRMFIQPADAPLPRHAVISLDLSRRQRFVFEDPRGFGRFTLDASALERLGPEPLGEDFTPDALRGGFARSRQAIKVKLLDQSLVAGIGNIYASEALHRAGISPRVAAVRLRADAVRVLWQSIRATLTEAIAWGSTVPLGFGGAGGGDGLFYFGRAAGVPDTYHERLGVYDRAGQPCGRCGGRIRRLVQAARSTYWCPGCQRGQPTSESQPWKIR